MVTFRFLQDPPLPLYGQCAIEAQISAQSHECRQACAVHCQMEVRGVRKVEEFAAWQLAEAFKSEVFALLKGSREAMRDRRFRYQLKDSASGPPKHITEGFVRFSPLDFCRFLDYALGSLREAEGWIRDGIEFGYFRKGTVSARVLVWRAVLHRNSSPEAQPGALRGTARA